MGDTLNIQFDKLRLSEDLELDLEKFRISDQPKLNINKIKNLRTYNQNLKSYACEGKLKNVINCINNGADIHIDRDYPLRMASMNGHLKIVQILLQASKGPRSFDFVWALEWSAKNGHLDIVKELLKFGAPKRILNKTCLKDYSTFSKRLVILYLIHSDIFVNTNYHFINYHLDNTKYDYNQDLVQSVRIKIQKRINRDYINYTQYYKSINNDISDDLFNDL
jgi:hypothetical protein